ncbi:MAG: 3-oxoacyl-ACP reductase FabG [Desulfobacteraceae bacterium]|nr:3-oxoacyl-ACP reductase FabG [Desulfobacteraceae bacterium]MCF8094286.1 3-oxoacyl-ACP reductase FabG [Desulfobacteraceae bacterium]
MTDNTDKPVALVTGGAGGIGSACCRALSAKGFRVGIHFRKSREPAEKLLSEIEGGGFLLQADLGDTQQIDAMVKQIKDEAGRLDVLVNNAGISVNEPIYSMKIDSFDAQRVVTRGAWYLTKRVLRVFMLRRSEGRIVNISSVVGHTGNAGQIAYTMEKAAIDSMTRSLAKEVAGRNILVNSVAPGFIDTEMTGELSEEIRQQILENTPLGRIGRPEEVAEVVAFLATGGTYIQGSVIHVNGGMYGG